MCSPSLACSNEIFSFDPSSDTDATFPPTAVPNDRITASPFAGARVGAVGTDAREWSLRQLIDRVVRTYTAAGQEHGYFADAADAEEFVRASALRFLTQNPV